MTGDVHNHRFTSGVDAVDVTSAGEYLADELAAREWTQADLAGILERPVQWVSEVITGKKSITAESAMQLAAALGTEPTTWLALQTRHQLHQLRNNSAAQDRLEQITLRAQISEIIPLVAMLQRGLIDPDSDLGALHEQLLHDFTRPPTEHTTGTTSSEGGLEGLGIAGRGWLWAALRAARELGPLPGFDPLGFTVLASSLAQTLHTPADLESLPQRFTQTGVALVMVEPLPGARDVGMLHWLESTPVIALSPAPKRFDRIVLQLLTLTARLAHHPDPNQPGQLAAADPGDAVVAHTVEQWILGQPWNPTTPLSRGRIPQEAAERGIAPDLLVGYLQHIGILDTRSVYAKTIPTADQILRTWPTTHWPRSHQPPCRG